MKRIYAYYLRIFLCILAALLSACGDSTQTSGFAADPQQQAQQIDAIQNNLNRLSQDLDNNRVRNATILEEYAEMLSRQRPELRQLINNLAADATQQGALYHGLQQRLNTLKTEPGAFLNPAQKQDEIASLLAATQGDAFNDALSDVVNVLADMSNGSLARVNASPKSVSESQNQAQDLGAGSQLIGNPAYGEWVTQSNGMSFWEWYGMYALFSHLVDGRRHDYGYWSRHRDYSYHHDFGRRTYASHQEQTKRQNLDQRYAKRTSSDGRRHTSTYSRSRSGAKGISNTSKRAASTFSRASNRSSVTGSLRNSSTYSRGISPGK